MPATFDDFGVRFLYPDNWQAVVDEVDGGNSVTLQLPSGGFCSILRDQTQDSNEQIVDQIRDAIIVDYNEVETELLKIEPFFDAGLALDLKFYYLDLLIISRTIVTRIAGQRFVIQLQAESRDFDANEPVFAAILKQLRECDL
ncbi:hypothetical protein Pla52o_03780 [Novipirellula galeiformis]|uniref:Uncharacterized protein n=1 Tax=Novipirellula galeiformis TaxID=2528004 RepID=A0A5C6CRP0_9BACT|nr:hypothetical protein [Novipirellula galeiformis]TWU26525.1 hypothetical protein Pla52o_03780 [Novipirellula galeiformis]